MSKYSLKRVSYKVKKHAVGVAKRSAALCFLVVIVVGLLLPAGVGYMMKTAGNVGVNTLVASSADTNSSTILGKSAEYWNGQYRYGLPVVSMSGWDYVITDTKNQLGSCSGTQTFFRWDVNRSVLKNVDNIVVYYNAVDGVLKNNSGRVVIRTSSGDICYYNKEYDNATGAYKIEIPVTPNILLKSADDSTVQIIVDGLNCEDGNPVGRTYKARLELYDTKGINAVTTKNIVLGASGILLLVVGLCATPWINPSEWYDELFNRRNRRRR
ncbi:hypothetical protein [Methanothermococcus okinawensis]|uniref:hypothetical protein n=1 Tax=Methanothermococcus okinawensis TaxID=155863 RepID=UPI0001E2C178|nr:hypothetical protein [Methanothermococcus okinawensis]